MPIRPCVTISLVPQARGGPFVFWDDLPAACQLAAEIGFDAVEVFPPSAEAVDVGLLRRLLGDCGLRLAAVGTGAGWVVRRLTLTGPDQDQRSAARDFVRRIIDLAGPFGASAIIGSMQGRWGEEVGRDEARALLGDALDDLGRHAQQYGVPLLYEPLNRYETNLANTVADGVALVAPLPCGNVKLLLDLFHMNIEEADPAGAIRSAAGHVGHLHFVDSNRRPAGLGHIDFGPIADALRAIGYEGYASAEALPHPGPEAAARQTIDAFRRHFAAES